MSIAIELDGRRWNGTRSGYKSSTNTTLVPGSSITNGPLTLKGYDLIPDSIPKIGLLDDALLVDTALHRNEDALRSHWAAKRRVFPETP